MGNENLIIEEKETLEIEKMKNRERREKNKSHVFLKKTFTSPETSIPKGLQWLACK